MTSYEEHFATSDDEISSEIIPVRRYVTRSIVNNVDKLKKENLEQIIEKKMTGDTKHEERIHYMQLDLANKELVIQEMISKIEHLEKVHAILYDFETAIKIARSNILCYNILRSTVSKADIASLMRKELSDIKEHRFSIDMEAFPPNVKDTLINIYTDTKAEELVIRDSFYAKIHTSKKKLFYILILEGVAGTLLFMFYIYIQFLCIS